MHDRNGYFQIDSLERAAAEAAAGQQAAEAELERLQQSAATRNRQVETPMDNHQVDSPGSCRDPQLQ